MNLTNHNTQKKRFREKPCFLPLAYMRWHNHQSSYLFLLCMKWIVLGRNWEDFSWSFMVITSCNFIVCGLQHPTPLKTSNPPTRNSNPIENKWKPTTQKSTSNENESNRTWLMSDDPTNEQLTHGSQAKYFVLFVPKSKDVWKEGWEEHLLKICEKRKGAFSREEDIVSSSSSPSH